ncbi:Aminoglycoside phosphotransferase [Kitasatospora sp. MMS16-BH015]|uniref:phosphotransferase family protein n=1 Tax=Kitasatospora sp. MMS16-BH015 TaxID=2018025 RepID=UPI000CA09F6F|nr:phosphotransferase [Kitasatospora sp. MMS16-BH015]AUG82044.1 Aminoglycoside phosphotransferase [Kitasatospora sp. MMS16-BH015]
MSSWQKYADEELAAVAEAALPGHRWLGAEWLRGTSYHVLLLPGTATVLVARTPAVAAELPRRAELLRRLARLGLPFSVPEPLAEVVTAHGRTAVALRWLYGEKTQHRFRDFPHRLRSVPPPHLCELLATLREVDTAPLADLLGAPHEGVGGEAWAELLLGEVVPRLPWTKRREARRRITVARDLPPAEPTLVHGRLDATNLLWNGTRLVGVLGWDRAQRFDPALDAGWLYSQHWEPRKGELTPEQLRRTRIWALTLGFEPLARAVLARAAGEDPYDWDEVPYQLSETVKWLDRTTGWWSREARR